MESTIDEIKSALAEGDLSPGLRDSLRQSAMAAGLDSVTAIDHRAFDELLRVALTCRSDATEAVRFAIELTQKLKPAVDWATLDDAEFARERAALRSGIMRDPRSAATRDYAARFTPPTPLKGKSVDWGDLSDEEFEKRRSAFVAARNRL